MSGLFSEDDQIVVRVLNQAEERIIADRPSLVAISSCVRCLPADAAVWDLSNFLIDGRPVYSILVRVWLNAVYTSLHDEPFDAFLAGVVSTMDLLHRVLACADAVGSSKGVVKALVAKHIPELHFNVTIGEHSYGFDASEPYQWNLAQHPSLGLCHHGMLSERCVFQLGSVEEKVEVMKQVTCQLEELLLLAYKLQLPQLLNKLHDIIRYHCTFHSGLLFGHLGAVLTTRVQDAAAAAPGMPSSSPVNKPPGRDLTALRAFVNSILTEPCTLARPPTDSQQNFIFEPIRVQEDGTAQPVHFSAVLTRDFMCWKAGAVMSLKLDLFNMLTSLRPCLWVQPEESDPSQSPVAVPVQLLLGKLVADQQHMDQLLTPPPDLASSPKPLYNL